MPQAILNLQAYSAKGPGTHLEAEKMIAQAREGISAREGPAKAQAPAVRSRARQAQPSPKAELEVLRCMGVGACGSKGSEKVQMEIEQEAKNRLEVRGNAAAILPAWV